MGLVNLCNIFGNDKLVISEFDFSPVNYTQHVPNLDAEYVFELLEDGNIVMSVFFPGEGEVKNCLSVYLVHPAE